MPFGFQNLEMLKYWLVKEAFFIAFLEVEVEIFYLLNWPIEEGLYFLAVDIISSSTLISTNYFLSRCVFCGHMSG